MGKDKDIRLGFYMEKPDSKKSVWPVRDVFYREFVNELYEGRLTPHQIDLLTQEKLYGKQLTRKDSFFRFFKGIQLRKFSVERLGDNQEFLLDKLNSTETKVVEVVLGLREPGTPPSKNGVAEALKPELGKTPVDIFLASAYEKLFLQKTKQ